MKFKAPFMLYSKYSNKRYNNFNSNFYIFSIYCMCYELIRIGLY